MRMFYSAKNKSKVIEMANSLMQSKNIERSECNKYSEKRIQREFFTDNVKFGDPEKEYGREVEFKFKQDVK